MTGTSSRKKISIITPCFNEEKNIQECARRVADVMKTKLSEYDYEHIFTDNDSSDRSAEILRELASNDPRIKVLINARNIGPFRNMANGIRFATGSLVVPMVPADLQDPPEVIPSFIEALSPDVDIVYGVRKNRKESFLLRACRSMYYKLVKVSGGGVSAPSHAGEFLLMREQVTNAVRPALGSYPYIRGLVAQTSGRYATVDYEWGIREHGKSRSSFASLIDQALNGLVATARAPIRISIFFGLILAIVGILYAVVSFFLYATGIVRVDPGIPTLIVAVTLFGGMQLLFLGLIGEYVMSIHSETLKRPDVLIVEQHNFD